jgi:hypothetical protein
MYYMHRSDRSMLVALPGSHPMGHYEHVTFLMARAGNPAAAALGMQAMPGVVPGAFDARLVNEASGSFLFRCLEGVDLEIDTHDRSVAVDYRADQLARLDLIAQGKRVRSDLRRWSRSTVAIRGGRLDNAAAHPDAGKLWTFGQYQQRLTDATQYRNAAATITLSSGPEVLSLSTADGQAAELWVVSAAGPRTDPPNPKRLEHANLLFEFLSGATSIVATCDQAEGRITVPTEMPCGSTTVASTVGGYTAAAPPYSELCPGGSGCCP